MGKRSVLIDVLLLAIAIGHVSCASVTFGFVETELLSGGLTGCPLWNSSTCTGGIAAASALARALARSGSNVIFLPSADRQSAFVQMHPLSWGVNGPVFTYLGVTAYLTAHSLLTEERSGFYALRNTYSQPLIANALVDPTDPWYGFVRRDVVNGDVGYAYIRSSAQPNSVNGLLTAQAVLNSFATRAVVLKIIIHDDDSISAPDFVYGCSRMAVKPDLVITIRTSYPMTVLNGTMFIGCVTSSSTMDFVEVTYNALTGSVSNVSCTYPSLTISSSLKDATYILQQAFLATETSKATMNDPVIGTSVNAMPVTRTGTYRGCQGGECQLGALFTNSFLWKSGADVAFTSSGGPRGPGWAAGPIKVSDIWAALPFANTLCTGVILGRKLWQVYNDSFGLATFSYPSTSMGDRLLQPNGLRITTNLNLTGSRIISIEVFNKDKNVYEPLQRTKLYKFAADNFLCQNFPPFSDQLGAPVYTGETKPEYTSITLQDIVAQYLTATGPYNTTIASPRIVYTTTTNIMNWSDTMADCRPNTYWVSGLGSCVACATGLQQPLWGQTACVAATSASSSIVVKVAVPIIVAVVVLVVAAALFLEMMRRKSVRNISNAPKGGTITLIFTDIQDSTKLWGTCPAAMSTALDIHHRLIRECITDHKGYEVKTVGDCFMIAIGDAREGVLLARDIQLKLQQVRFPKAIASVYTAKNDDELDAIVDNAEELADIDPIWNGLRVRIGVHSGKPEAVFDEVAKGYDYYGPPSNIAARVESVACGGQICCTRDVLQDSKLDCGIEQVGCVISFIGATELKGVTGKTEIIQIVPLSLRARSFKPLQEEEILDEGSNAESATASMAGDPSAEENAQDNAAYFMAMLQLLKPQKQREVVSTIAKTWRVPCKESTPLEKIVLAVTQRALHSVHKARRNMAANNVSAMKRRVSNTNKDASMNAKPTSFSVKKLEGSGIRDEVTKLEVPEQGR